MSASDAQGAAQRAARRKMLRETTSTVVRDAILAAAERVFGEVGFGEAKMTAIGREAGLAAGTLYNYFESKDVLLRSLVEQRGAELFERLSAAVQAAPDPRGRLLATVRLVLEFLEEHSAMFTVLVEQSQPHKHGHVCRMSITSEHDRFRRFHEHTLRQAREAGLVRADVTLADQAAALGGIMHGFISSWLLRGRRPGLSARAELVVDLFLNGVGAPP